MGARLVRGGHAYAYPSSPRLVQTAAPGRPFASASTSVLRSRTSSHSICRRMAERGALFSTVAASSPATATARDARDPRSMFRCVLLSRIYFVFLLDGSVLEDETSAGPLTLMQQYDE